MRCRLRICQILKAGDRFKAGRVRLPCISGVLSISSIEMPKVLQYSMCSLISWKMCLIISADCTDRVRILRAQYSLGIIPLTLEMLPTVVDL